MDKIPEFIAGVRLLLPGIVAATIFYLYSDAKLDQFFFIVFCVIFVGLTEIVSRSLVSAAKLAAKGALGTWAWLKLRACRTFPTIQKPIGRSGTGPSPDQVLADVQPQKFAQIRFALELLIAVGLGLLMVKSYENDFTFKMVNRLMSTERQSGKETLDYVSDLVVKKDWLRFDQRPDDRKWCKKGAKDCDDDVYVRIRLKGEGDVYEGAVRYYSAPGQHMGMFLSPACVRRQLEHSKLNVLQEIAGPGAYVNLAEIHSIEYLAIRDSDCFKLFYPAGAAHLILD
jgi:hypothetical protein